MRDPQRKPPQADFILTVKTLKKVEDSWTFESTFVNRSDSVVYLFDRQYVGFSNDGRAIVNKDLLLINKEGDVVILAKKALDPPPYLLVERRYLPYLTKVYPGQSRAEEIHVPRPAENWNPYIDDTPGQGQLTLIPAYYELGFFVGSSVTDSVLTAVPSTEGPLWSVRGFDSQSQRILRTGPFVEKILYRDDMTSDADRDIP